MPSITVPDYSGGSLINLVAELEQRLAGTSPTPPLHADAADTIPNGTSYVLALFDGLGARQLGHPRAGALRSSLRGELDAPFPATTTVSLASLATALPPSQHGLLGYQLWMPELDTVVNTIKWTTLWGEPVDFDTSELLPRPNLWERLSALGVEPITVQPAGFAATPLTRALYRGCRFEGVYTVHDWVDAVVQLAVPPSRFVFGYLPQVDFAAHVHGQASSEYADAVATVDFAWERLSLRLPAGAVAVGTADHGHVDFPPDRQVKLAKADHAGRTFYGDGRAMFVRGEGATLADALPATWFSLDDMRHWWGPEPVHPSLPPRAPDGVLLADDDRLLLHRHSDDRMIGNHGALTDEERLVPLLVADGSRTPGSR